MSSRRCRLVGAPSAALVLTAAAALALVAAAPARAGGNDLALSNLCAPRTTTGLVGGAVSECSWVRRDSGTGRVLGTDLDDAAQARFRSLMSELGVVLAPRLLVPAETLGFAGFQFAAELGMTSISQNQSFWNGVEGVSAQNPQAARPSPWLTTIGGYVRKGVWLGVPAFEFGAGAMHLIDSHLVAWQGYAKLALFEGYDRSPLPSVAVRASGSYVTGTDQVDMHVVGLDVILSKAFGVAGTFRIQPFAGASALFIYANAAAIDLTPGCDAFATRTAGPPTPLGPGCAEAQRGSDDDRLATVAFAGQSRISRQRFFAGAKARIAPVFLTAELEVAPPGHSRDRKRPGGVRDDSGSQRTLSLSAGLDF